MWQVETNESGNEIIVFRTFASCGDDAACHAEPRECGHE